MTPIQCLSSFKSAIRNKKYNVGKKNIEEEEEEEEKKKKKTKGEDT